MQRATVQSVQEFAQRCRNVLCDFHQGQAYIVTFDESVRRPRTQNELAKILWRWVHSSAVACPLSFAERVAREIGDDE